jgi:hypothetical protein
VSFSWVLVIGFFLSAGFQGVMCISFALAWVAWCLGGFLISIPEFFEFDILSGVCLVFLWACLLLFWHIVR